MKALGIFERKMLRGIYGPVKEVEGYRIRTIKEIEEILKIKNVEKKRRLGRLRNRWLQALGEDEDYESWKIVGKNAE